MIAGRPQVARRASEIHTMDPHDPIQKLQESQLFAERRCEELNEAVLDLADQLTRVVARIGSLESRLVEIARMTAGADDVDVEPEIESPSVDSGDD